MLIRFLTINFSDLGQIVISYNEVSLPAMSEELQSLHNHTMAAMEKAYAPYSKFQVGCGILLENGEIITGNNQENAAYPSGLCAERIAFFKLRSEQQTPIRSVMVTTKNQLGQRPESFPCGACRQVMLEYAMNQEDTISFYMQVDANSFYELADLRMLLPFSFTKNVL